MVECTKANVLRLGPNRSEVITYPKIRIPENLDRKQRPVFQVYDKNLPSPRVILIESVKRIFSAERELLRKRQGLVGKSERDFRMEGVSLKIRGEPFVRDKEFRVSDVSCRQRRRGLPTQVHQRSGPRERVLILCIDDGGKPEGLECKLVCGITSSGDEINPVQFQTIFCCDRPQPLNLRSERECCPVLDLAVLSNA